MGVPDSTVVVLPSRTAPSKWKWLFRRFFLVAALTQLHYLLRERGGTQRLSTLGPHHEKDFRWYSV